MTLLHAREIDENLSEEREKSLKRHDTFEDILVKYALGCVPVIFIVLAIASLMTWATIVLLIR